MRAKRVLFESLVVTSAIALNAATRLPQDRLQPRRIEIMAKRFAFVPSELTLKKGQPVVLVLQSEDVLHGIRFKELNLDTEIRKGHPSELEFTPEKAGTFVGHCSRFCGTGHGEMILTLNITE